MEAIGGYQLVREIGGWETRWFIYTAYKLDDPKKTEVVLKTCLTADLPPNPPGIPSTIPAFLVAANHQREAAAQCKGIVPILASGSENGRVYNVTPRYTFSIERLITSKHDVSDAGLEKLAGNILDCLERLQKTRSHSHGNIKPSNVFLVGNARPSKADIILGDLAPDTQSHSIAGDIQALGHLLHQLIRKRELDESFYPLQISEEWDELAGDAQKWLHCLNRFLDPALAQSPDPLKAARDALRSSGRDAAGGTIKQGAKAIKEVGTSKGVQSTVWIGIFITLLAGGAFFVHHKLTDATAGWQQVQTKNHLWLNSVRAELTNPQTATIWGDPANPELRFATEKITRILQESPTTINAVITSPALPKYDPVKDKEDRYRLEGNKNDPEKVEKLKSDLEGIHTSLANYLPEAQRTRLRQFQEHLAAVQWPIPNALTKAVAFDPTNENELGAAISATLPLAPLLFTEDRLALLDRLAANTAKILPVKDPLLHSYTDETRKDIARLLAEPINPQLWNDESGSLLRRLKKRDANIADLKDFLDGKNIAFDRVPAANSDTEVALNLDDPDFAKNWIRLASQYAILENPDTLRKTWTEQWAKKSKNRSGIEDLDAEFKKIIDHPVLVTRDLTDFNNLIGGLELVALDEAPVAATTPTPPPANTADAAKANAGYQALLQKYLAQIRAANAADIAGVAAKFRTEVAAFANLPGVQDFLDKLSINLARKTSGWRPKGFPGATRPNPADPLLFNIPLNGRGTFPFRLITPASGQPFFLAAWEVPIALLTAADFDSAHAEGPHFWEVIGGALSRRPQPVWAELQAEMTDKDGKPIKAYFSDQVAKIQGGDGNEPKLPANFVTPPKAGEVAKRYGFRLPTQAEWKAAYELPENAKDGWLRGAVWKQQVDYIINNVGARLKANLEAGQTPIYPNVFPNTRANGTFDPAKTEDYDKDATQTYLFFSPTFTAANPNHIKDMRGNVSEIVTNGNGYAVMGPSVLSSPNFTTSNIYPGDSYSDVGFRFAVDAAADSGISNIPQLFTDEAQRLSQ